MLIKNPHIRSFISTALRHEGDRIAFSKDIKSQVKTIDDVPVYYNVMNPSDSDFKEFHSASNKFQKEHGSLALLNDLPHSCFILVGPVTRYHGLEIDSNKVTSQVLLFVRETKDQSFLIDSFEVLDSLDFITHIYIEIYGLKNNSSRSYNYLPTVLSSDFIVNETLTKRFREQCTSDVIKREFAAIITPLYYFLNKLSLDDVVMATQPRSFKLEKKHYSSFNLTYVSSKKTFLEDVSKGYIPANINWQYSWIVRGHWRKESPDFIGKDRDGERNQVGRTWVSEGIKNKGLPFVNPLRLVK